MEISKDTVLNGLAESAALIEYNMRGMQIDKDEYSDAIRQLQIITTAYKWIENNGKEN